MHCQDYRAFESLGEDISGDFPDDASSRQTCWGLEGPVFDGVPVTELGADQVDEPTAESVVAVAGVEFTPERVAGSSMEGGVRILPLRGPSKLTKEGTSFGGENDECLEGLASLEDTGGVTRALQGLFSRAAS